MDNLISGSFAEFDPKEVIKFVDEHLDRIERIKTEAKVKWFDEKRSKGKRTGLLFFKKVVPFKQYELEEIWSNGENDDAWFYNTPKNNLWDCWDATIKSFTRIKSFCQLATVAGNMTVYLSKEDALLAYNWDT